MRSLGTPCCYIRLQKPGLTKTWGHKTAGVPSFRELMEATTGLCTYLYSHVLTNKNFLMETSKTFFFELLTSRIGWFFSPITPPPPPGWWRLGYRQPFYCSAQLLLNIKAQNHCFPFTVYNRQNTSTRIYSFTWWKPAVGKDKKGTRSHKSSVFTSGQGRFYATYTFLEIWKTDKHRPMYVAG